MPFPPSKDPTHGFSPEALENMRRRYEETDEPQASIAIDFGRSRRTIERVAKDQGWKLRNGQPTRDIPQALKIDMTADEELAKQAPPDAPNIGNDDAVPDAANASSVVQRLEAAVEKELRKVESLRGQFGARTKRSIEAERTARTLATLTETLFKVRRLREPGNISGSNDDDLPADADGFRLALAHRIEVFVRSRTDGSVSQGDKPADGEPAAS
ncbi:MAG TPA: hypothetical protein VN838_10360 [Bradyrhizobium sp.]|nr:hypothetical protein [Bradyrhizobium sp.]